MLLGDPLAQIIRGRPVEQHGGTEKAISRAHDWVNECNEHSNCSPGETLLPCRVVDVGNDVNSPYAKLWETDGEERGKYISLRYLSRLHSKGTHADIRSVATAGARHRNLLPPNQPSKSANVKSPYLICRKRIKM